MRQSTEQKDRQTQQNAAKSTFCRHITMHQKRSEQQRLFLNVTAKMKTAPKAVTDIKKERKKAVTQRQKEP